MDVLAGALPHTLRRRCDFLVLPLRPWRSKTLLIRYGDGEQARHFAALRFRDVAPAVFRQQETLLDESLHRRLVALEVFGVAAVAFLDRKPRIVACDALGAGACERRVGAVAIAELAF